MIFFHLFEVSKLTFEDKKDDFLYPNIFFPTAYTQIITLSVYSYLYSHLFGRQFLEPKEEDGLPPGDELTLLRTGEHTMLAKPFLCFCLLETKVIFAFFSVNTFLMY